MEHLLVGVFWFVLGGLVLFLLATGIIYWFRTLTGKGVWISPDQARHVILMDEKITQLTEEIEHLKTAQLFPDRTGNNNATDQDS